MNAESGYFDLWTSVLVRKVKMAEVDFGDTELFQQLDDSAPPVPSHIRFTDNEEDEEEKGLPRSQLEEYDDHIQRLTEENILTSVSSLANLC